MLYSIYWTSFYINNSILLVVGLAYGMNFTPMAWMCPHFNCVDMCACNVYWFIVCDCSLLVALVWFCYWLLLHECSCTLVWWWKLLLYHKLVISSLTCRMRRKWKSLFTGNKTWSHKSLDTGKTMWQVSEGCGIGYLTFGAWKRKRSKIKSGVVP
jgi:hypothetical protein